MNKVINGIWSGPELSDLEKLCIRSFQDNGHEFHLWVSNLVIGIPNGTVVCNTDDIVKPQIRWLFSNERHFSDYVRVYLIYERGGWYTDLDFVCLRPFDFSDPYVFTSEESPERYELRFLDLLSNEIQIIPGAFRHPETPLRRPSEVVQETISNCIFKAPPHAPFLKEIMGEIEKRNLRDIPNLLTDLKQGIGAALFRDAIPKFGLQSFVKAPIILDALNIDEYLHFINGGIKWDISKKSYAMHLRRTCWSYTPNEPFEQLKINGRYHPDSLFEQLKRKHGIR